jgi:cellulose synthase/poly-beta-1,6-N-acetylglucosamine synthase-like glycosyltransferase
VTGPVISSPPWPEEDGRIRLVRQVNLGKARALIRGLQEVRHGIVVSLDADTQFEPGTITELVRPFADPRVGAVSGRARVGNIETLFARFQALEYSCGFNLDRRAYDRLNCITVVPGAVSAFRLDAIRAAGGISNDTLAEDTDLTLSLHRQGYRIRYAPRAGAWTEAPETPRTFARQRFRWAFGTLQCLWKHRDLLFALRHGALGWFSLPNAWFFNFFLVAIGLLVDVVLLAALVLNPTNLLLYIYFFTFIATDMLLAAVAYWIERESLAPGLAYPADADHLPARLQLRRRQGHPQGPQGRLGGLGQTGSHGLGRPRSGGRRAKMSSPSLIPLAEAGGSRPSP